MDTFQSGNSGMMYGYNKVMIWWYDDYDDMPVIHNVHNIISNPFIPHTNLCVDYKNERNVDSDQNKHTLTNTNTNTHTQTHTQTHAHTHIHTHTHIDR